MEETVVNENIIGKKCDSLRELSLEDKELVLSFTKRRRIESCEYSLTTLFMWQNMYNPHLYIDENYMIIFEHYEDLCYALMPVCTEKYFVESFEKVLELFKDIDEEFEMYCVDDAYAAAIGEFFGDEYKIEAPRELTDYIYSADKLRTLKGNKLRKKKNHINAFYRENAGRFDYRLLNLSDKKEIITFLTRWCVQHGDTTSHLDEELIGIHVLLENLDVLEAKVLGVFIDGQLEAFSIASLINDGTEAIIHVEKANSDVRGLYPYINQLFVTEFLPEVELVNREDDLGVEGLRRAKLSYEPVKLENKYTITRKKA